MSERLDVALARAGLARSRSHAADLVRRGRVEVDGRVAARPSQRVAPETRIEVETERWVGRGALKLAGALDDLAEEAGARVSGARVLDAGASTGGFTQVCLERGAAVVYAVDVGHGQLDPRIAHDPRVRVREGLNLRDLTLADLDGEPVDLVVGDVSFISLTLLLAPFTAVSSPDTTLVLLVKPQFEVGRAGLPGHGVVTAAGDRRRAVDLVVARAAELGWRLHAEAPCRLPGQDGNLEHFVVLGH